MLTKCQVYKTSIELKASKRQVFKFDTPIKQKGLELPSLHMCHFCLLLDLEDKISENGKKSSKNRNV
jgi:hypothetical protein